jgi:hypothetical protein
MGVWQGVAMDSLQFHSGRHAPPFYELTVVLRVACLQGGRPVTVFYPYERPTLYTYGFRVKRVTLKILNESSNAL